MDGQSLQRELTRLIATAFVLSVGAGLTITTIVVGLAVFFER